MAHYNEKLTKNDIISQTKYFFYIEICFSEFSITKFVAIAQLKTSVKTTRHVKKFSFKHLLLPI